MTGRYRSALHITELEAAERRYADLELQVRALVEAANLARDFLAKLPIPMTRRAEADYRVGDLHATLAPFAHLRAGGEKGAGDAAED